MQLIITKKILALWYYQSLSLPSLLAFKYKSKGIVLEKNTQILFYFT